MPPPSTPTHLATKIELVLSAENLSDKDVLSKSDPFCVVSSAPALPPNPDGTPNTNPISTWTRVGLTEVVDNNLSPHFSRRIPMDYYFEAKQMLRVDVYDCDDKKNLTALEKHEKLGFVETNLPYIMGMRGTVRLPVQGGCRGFVTISIVEIGSDTNQMLELRVAGHSMRKMDTFGKSDCYLKVFRRIGAGIANQETMLYKTEVKKNTLEPTWAAWTVAVGNLCGTKLDSPVLRIECWDEDTFSDDSMGEIIVSVDDIIAGKSFTLRKPSKPQKEYGTLSFAGSKSWRVPSFLDYIRGGVGLSFAASIDFTGSNGDPRNPTSLHYINPSAPNHYSHAIMAVGDVLAGYVTNSRFPCFGFGAKLPNNDTSHFFPLTFDPANCTVGSIQDMLFVYASALTRVSLSGPTNFAPTIRNVRNMASEGFRSTNVYTILLIITDGEITDLLDTIDELVASDDAPLSVIIVGVGTACDFQQMEVLDADTTPLTSSTGRRSRRDLVQFVPMRQFAAQPQCVLAREVLCEIPNQFMEWTRLIGLKPPARE
eukprot:PhM_4_TR4309/c0_g1_i1/m.25697